MSWISHPGRRLPRALPATTRRLRTIGICRGEELSAELAKLARSRKKPGRPLRWSAAAVRDYKAGNGVDLSAPTPRQMPSSIMEDAQAREVHQSTIRTKYRRTLDLQRVVEDAMAALAHEDIRPPDRESCATVGGAVAYGLARRGWEVTHVTAFWVGSTIEVRVRARGWQGRQTRTIVRHRIS